MFDEKYQKQYLKNLAIESQLLNSMTSYSQGVFQKKQQELYHIDDNYIPSTENPLNIQPDTIVQDELLNIESEKQALQLNLFKITNSTVINDDIIAKLSDLEIQYLNVFFEDFKTKLKEKKIKLKTTTQLVDFIKKYLDKNSNAISKGDISTEGIKVKEEQFNVPTPKQEEMIVKEEISSLPIELQKNTIETVTAPTPKKQNVLGDELGNTPLVPIKTNKSPIKTKPDALNELENKEFQFLDPSTITFYRTLSSGTQIKLFIKAFVESLDTYSVDEEYKQHVQEIIDGNLNNVKTETGGTRNYTMKGANKAVSLKMLNDLYDYILERSLYAVKGGLGLKKKQRRHQGNGIDSKDFEKGKIYCDIAKLNELILSIKYRNTGNKKTNDIPINENIKSIILDICLKKFDNAKYNKLSKEEQKVIIYFIEEMKIDNVKIDNNPINAIYTEYKILMGEIESGNDSSLIKKRLKTILFELHKYKKINSAQLRNVMFNIDNSN